MQQASPIPQASIQPRIGEWISEAFDLFQREWKVWVGQGGIYLGLVFGPLILGYVVMYGAFIAGIIASGPSGSGSSSSSPTWMLGGLAVGGVIFGLGMLMALYFGTRLMIGMKLTAEKQLRGEPIAVGDVWQGGEVFWSYLGASILMILGIMVGMYLCLVVPGFIFMGLSCFTLPLVVERRMGAVEAIRTSWEITKPHMWWYVLWAFVAGLIGSVGAYACYVGMAATMPIMILAQMIAYRDVVGIPGALPSTRQSQVAAAAGYVPGAPIPAGNCPQCGAVVYQGGVVCPSCGLSLYPGSQAQPPAPPAGGPMVP